MIDYMQKQTKLIEEAFNSDTRFTTARDKVRFYHYNVWTFNLYQIKRVKII